MKLLIRYLSVLGLAILLSVIIISYHSYKAKTSDQSIEKYTQPLINSQLNALVIDKSATNVSERIQSQNAMVYSLRVHYTDLESGQDSSFVMNSFNGKRIAIGDTVLKEKGSIVLVLHKKQGEIFTLQVR